MNSGRRPLSAPAFEIQTQIREGGPRGWAAATRRTGGARGYAATSRTIGDRLPFGKLWRRRQDGQRRCVRQADHAQGAVVRGMVRLLLRRLCPAVGVADRNAPGRVSADG